MTNLPTLAQNQRAAQQEGPVDQESGINMQMGTKGQLWQTCEITAVTRCCLQISKTKTAASSVRQRHI